MTCCAMSLEDNRNIQDDINWKIKFHTPIVYLKHPRQNQAKLRKIRNGHQAIKIELFNYNTLLLQSSTLILLNFKFASKDLRVYSLFFISEYLTSLSPSNATLNSIFATV
ncbi:hypothetical protein QLX08_011296 [Tetragonisca angustula]|uniref:Uncharacterized protein n=1 Tax=Tetragonisca angustula TaxID=166442 RepID=A0AAW0Z8T0_9HYME